MSRFILAWLFLWQVPIGFNRGTVEHDGVQRTFNIYVPETYNEETPLPLIVALHPSGGNGASMARITQFNELAEDYGFIAIYPEGPYEYWDYGAGLPEWEDVPDVLDDPGFISTLLGDLDEILMYDHDRVYAVGFSNGARIAFRLGCEFPETFTGIAAVSATISDEITTHCADDAHPSVIFMHGTADGVIPWAGKPLYIDSTQISIALSAPETGEFWAEHNHCETTETIDLPDADPQDRFTVEQTIYSDCENDSDVHFYGIQGGGHQWFNFDDFEASQIILDFLLKQENPTE